MVGMARPQAAPLKSAARYAHPPPLPLILAHAEQAQICVGCISQNTVHLFRWISGA